MGEEILDGSFQRGDDDLPISIILSRDAIIFDDKLEQDYWFLTYRFRCPSGDILTRVYLNDVWEVSITEPTEVTLPTQTVIAHLQKHFRLIKQLGGANGYYVIWRQQGKRQRR
jgi:hypothetical protein